MKVAIFESDEYLARAMEREFRAFGFETTWFEFPPENTSEAVAKENPDLITMDINMNVMDGFQATSIIKHDQRTRQIPLVFYSNLTSQEYVDRSSSLGAVGYYKKSETTPRSLANESLRILTAGSHMNG